MAPHSDSDSTGEARPAPQARVAMGKNPGRARSHNRRVLLEILRRHGPLGRKALADMVQISTQAVTNIIDELSAEGLVLDLGRKRTSRGQPPILYAINPGGAISLGIEISVGALVATVLDLGGNPREVETLQLADMAPERVLEECERLVERLSEGHGARLMGIGVVMPGPFGIEGLSGIGPTTLPGWEGVDVRRHLAQRFAVPVLVDNDANAAAMGEMLFGKGRNLSDFCLIYFGAGIGLGAFLRDQPLRGARGNAGEIGHIVVAPGGLPCQCGQAGCLERYASRHALNETLVAAGLAPADAAALHAAGHPVVAAWVAEAARHLSLMIGLVENIFDPETVILGGKLPEPLLEDILSRLAVPPSVAHRADRLQPRVQLGRTGQASAALGAAAMALHDAISPRLDIAGADEPEGPA
ncbi:ROK family transcriptional regulator [Oceanicella sp. SM1341]|uniref:ROK family transcriptional regulator n=1 Tax=Oceanicella sp. SM1341 TaxID=1548889 RepID=UPI000E4EAB0E|nr:ROK family transcriptional regulator [Oceanicella sp. SM1341]